MLKQAEVISDVALWVLGSDMKWSVRLLPRERLVSAFRGADLSADELLKVRGASRLQSGRSQAFCRPVSPSGLQENPPPDVRCVVTFANVNITRASNTFCSGCCQLNSLSETVLFRKRSLSYVQRFDPDVCCKFWGHEVINSILLVIIM